MTTLEINSKTMTIATVEDLKFQREAIIEVIEIEEAPVKEVMQQIVEIVTASNWSELSQNNDRDDLIYMAIDSVNLSEKIGDLVDNSEMYAKASLNQRPSSMR